MFARFVKRSLMGLAMVGFGIILAMLLIEVGLRIVPESIWKKSVSKSPWRHILFQTDKDIGWVHMPNVQMNWQGSGEYNVDVQINSLGLRDYERTYAKPAGTFRILVLGDSFAEAIQVPLDKTFSAQLEKCLDMQLNRPVEVINAGVSGYGPGDELLYYTYTGVKFQPDLVLVTVFLGNDIRNMEPELGSSMLEAFGGYQFTLVEGQLTRRWVEWAEPNYEISGFERFLRRYSKLYYIFKSPDSLVPHRIEDLTDLLQPASEDSSADSADSDVSDAADQKPGQSSYIYDEGLIIFAKNFPDNPLVPPKIKNLWELFKAPFAELQAETKTHGAKLAVTIFPRGAQVHQTMYGSWVAKYKGKYDGLRWSDWDIGAPDKAIKDFLTKEDIPVLDLLPGFRTYAQTHDELLYFASDGHFSEMGHRVAAGLMCRWLIDDGLVPLPPPAASQK